MPQSGSTANPTRWLAAIAILWSCAPLLRADDPPPGASTFFEMRIRPILVKRCFSCHTAGRMGGLEMSGRDGLLKGGGRGAAISLNRPERSLLLQAISYQLDTLKMPPLGKLPNNE